MLVHEKPRSVPQAVFNQSPPCFSRNVSVGEEQRDERKTRRRTFSRRTCDKTWHCCLLSPEIALEGSHSIVTSEQSALALQPRFPGAALPRRRRHILSRRLDHCGRGMWLLQLSSIADTSFVNLHSRTNPLLSGRPSAGQFSPAPRVSHFVL